MDEERYKRYQEFVNHFEGRVPDPLPRSTEYRATREDIEFYREYQLERAIKRAKIGNATSVELSLIRNSQNH